MTITTESISASQRKHFRITIPITVMIAGREYIAEDWSAGGMRVINYGGYLEKDEEFAVSLQIPFNGYTVGVPVIAIVKDVDSKTQSLTVTFKPLKPAEKEVINSFVSGIMSGEMVGIDGTIRRLDVPVTPFDTKPDQPLDPVVEDRRRKLGIAIYSIIGFLLTLMFSSLVYNNLYVVEAGRAVYAADIEVLSAPINGSVREVLISKNQILDKGSPLMTFIDTGREQQMEVTKIRYGVAQEEIEAVRRRVNTLRNNLSLKRSVLERNRLLFSQNVINKLRLDEAESEFFEVQSLLSEAEQDLARLESRARAEKDREPKRKKGEAAAKKGEENMITLDAAFNTTVREVLVKPGEGVRAGDPVAVMLRNEDRYMIAEFPWNQAMKLRVGNVAEVTFGGQQTEPFLFVVRNLDTLDQFVALQDGYFLSLPSKTAELASIKLYPLKQDTVNRIEKSGITPGTPAQVVINSRRVIN
jgi:multidrug resistance efflux pump